MAKGQAGRKGRGRPAPVGKGRPGGAPSRSEPAPDLRRWEAGLAAFARRDWSRALAAWKNCALPHARPAQAEALLRRALAVAQVAAAAADLRAAMELAPDDPRFPYHLGLLLARAGGGGALGPLNQAARLAPGEARFREARDLCAALTGTAEEGAEARLRLLAGCIAPDGHETVPTAWPGAPGWVAQLVGAMAALGAGDWERAAAEAEAVAAAGAELPGAVAQLAVYWSAWAQALAGRAPGSPEIPGHPWPSGSGRLQRWLVAARLDRALTDGDAALAASLRERFEQLVSPAREVRDLVTARLGAARARQNDWAGALECFRAVGRRYSLAQAVAIAAEGAGDARAAVDAWGQVAAAAERGELPARVHDPEAVRAIARQQQVRLLEEGAPQHDEGEALRARRAALEAQGEHAKVGDVLALAEELRRSADAPGRRWEEARALAARAVALAPDDPDAWAEHRALAILHDDLPTAWNAGARLAERLPGHRRTALLLLELTGRASIKALLAGRPQDIPRYCAQADATTLALGAEHAEDPPLVLMREMALALAHRARGGPLPTRKAAWAPMLRRNAPPSAYALRGIIELFGRTPARAERWFERCEEDHEEIQELELVTAYQLADIAYAHCWVHQLTAGPGAARGQECAAAPLCQKMWAWLARAAARAPAVARQPPPEALAACPALRLAHRSWARRVEEEAEEEGRRLKRGLRRLKQDGLLDELGDLSAADLADLVKGVLPDA